MSLPMNQIKNITMPMPNSRRRNQTMSIRRGKSKKPHMVASTLTTIKNINPTKNAFIFTSELEGFVQKLTKLHLTENAFSRMQIRNQFSDIFQIQRLFSSD
jgi:hypothetical protein